MTLIWNTDYDPLQDGPPYLPSNVKSKRVHASGQSPERLLTAILALLRAASLIHQTNHWNVRGSYGDHEMFMRIYEESQEFIDQLAEKSIGLGVLTEISAVSQAKLVYDLVRMLGQGQGAIQTSLVAEETVLEWLRGGLESLEEHAMGTPGLRNLLEGVADKHESFVYLLKQRLGEYSYKR